jgi:hypothetical protein
MHFGLVLHFALKNTPGSVPSFSLLYICFLSSFLGFNFCSKGKESYHFALLFLPPPYNFKQQLDQKHTNMLTWSKGHLLQVNDH